MRTAGGAGASIDEAEAGGDQIARRLSGRSEPRVLLGVAFAHTVGFLQRGQHGEALRAACKQRLQKD